MRTSFPLTAAPGPQALPALPQQLEEVLVVVGGRALEEAEEGAEEPAPHLENFAFYNAKASEYAGTELRLPPDRGPCEVLREQAHPGCARASGGGGRDGGRGCGRWGAPQAPLLSPKALGIVL